jgi:hypothetical protein
MSGFTAPAAPQQSWAVQWLMSRRQTDEQTAVLTMSTEVLDGIQDKHDDRRKEIDAVLTEELMRIEQLQLPGTDLALHAATRKRLADSAQKSHDAAIARLDLRSKSVQDIQRIIATR